MLSLALSLMVCGQADSPWEAARQHCDESRKIIAQLKVAVEAVTAPRWDDCKPLSSPDAIAKGGWYRSANFPGWLALLSPGRKDPVAYFHPVGGRYEILDPLTKQWLQSRPPWAESKVEPKLNFGIDESQLHQGTRYCVNGVTTTREIAQHTLQGALTDDRTQPRLTAIGGEAFRKALLADLESAPSLAAWKGKIVVNAYDPSFWAAQPFGAEGDTIILQQPDGREVSRTYGYTCGPDGLARALGDYDPKKTPDLTKPKTPPGLDTKTLAIGGAVVAGAVAFLLLRGGSGKTKEADESLPREGKRWQTSRPAKTIAKVVAPIDSEPHPLLAVFRDYAAARQRQEEERQRQSADHEEMKGFFRDMATAGEPVAVPATAPATVFNGSEKK